MRSLPDIGSGDHLSVPGRLVGSLLKERAVDPNAPERDAYRELIDLLPAAVYVCRPDGTINNYNRRAAELWGRVPKLGDTDERFCGSFRLFRIDGTPLPHDKTPMADVLRTGVPALDLEVVILRPDGSRITVLANIAPIRNDAGELIGAVNCFQDITERKRVEEQQRLLVAELNHRVKNTLAVVQALALQTLQRSPSPEAFGTAFMGRLQALARAHTLFSELNWRPTALHRLVDLALEPYRPNGNRVDPSGEEVLLPPAQALTLSLVFHELATNAAKYGALSVPSGNVRVTWRKEGADEAEHLRILWQESGGPKVAEPAGRGFGLTLIERSVGHELGGAAIFRFPEDGLVCDMTVTLVAEAETAVGDGPAPAPPV